MSPWVEPNNNILLIIKRLKRDGISTLLGLIVLIILLTLDY